MYLRGNIASLPNIGRSRLNLGAIRFDSRAESPINRTRISSLSSSQTADTVVIGAGAVGCAVALQLARRGMKTLVIERDGIAFNASAYAWGGLSAHFGNGVPGPMTDHYRNAIAQHIQLYDELNSTSTLDWQLQRVTSLSLADNDENASLLGNDVEWMQSEGFEAEMIASETIYDLEPAIRPGMVAASVVNSGWELDSLTYTKALASESQRLGAIYKTGRVASVESSSGTVKRVVLDNQTRIDTPIVIAATGPWVSAIDGIPALPIKPIKGEILRLERDGNDLVNRVGFGGFNVGRKPDGTVWAGTYEWDRGFNRDVTDEGRQHIWDGTTGYLPSLANSRIVNSTACLRPVATDGIPIVGASNVTQGLHYANGAGKKGILLSPLMADWIVGCIIDGVQPPATVSPNRFANI